MIEVNYNEYKETLAENMKLIVENGRLNKALSEIERLKNIIEELRIKNQKLLEENMNLIKEINLHSGKLVINELEVKEVF